MGESLERRRIPLNELERRLQRLALQKGARDGAGVVPREVHVTPLPNPDPEGVNWTAGLDEGLGGEMIYAAAVIYARKIYNID